MTKNYKGYKKESMELGQVVANEIAFDPIEGNDTAKKIKKILHKETGIPSNYTPVKVDPENGSIEFSYFCDEWGPIATVRIGRVE